MDVLKTRLDLLDKALKYGQEYFDNIDGVLQKHAKNDHESLHASLKLIEDSKPNLDLISYKNNIDRIKVIANLFHNMDNINIAVSELIRIGNIEDYLDRMLITRSKTWGDQLQDKREVMVRHIDEMRTLERDNDDAIARDLYEHVKDDIGSPSGAQMIDIIVNAKSSNFIVYISRYIIDIIGLEDRLRILERTEKKKDEVLQTETLDFSGYPLPQRLVSMRGLYPITQSMPVKDIIKTINPNYKYIKDKSDIDNLLSMGSSIIGVIVLEKYGFNPIEYDTRTLIDLKHVVGSNTDITPETGISNMAIKRYQTINVIGAPVKIPKLGTEIHTNIVGTPPDVYIIETINKKDYRIVGTKFDVFTTPYETAIKLTHDVSSRPTAYNKIMEDIIVPFLDPTEQRINAYPNRVKIFTSFEGVKKQIIDRIVSKFNEHIIAAEVDSFETALNALKNQKETIIRTTNYIIGREMDLDKIEEEFRTSIAIAFDEMAFEIGIKYQYYLEHFDVSELIFKEYKEQELMKYLTDMYRDEIVKIYSELDSYPSKFESFEAPIKMYVFNKKIFMH